MNTRIRSFRPGLRILVQILAVLLLIVATSIGAKAAWIGAKAVVAQVLLEHAWRETVAFSHDTGKSKPVARSYKPWPWADITPVLRLEAPVQKRSLIVLDDASGESLAFGPGLVAGDPDVAEHSTIVLGGHRDTHLSFLEHVGAGEEIRLATQTGKTLRYTTTRSRIVDTRKDSIAIDSDVAALVLITCWPFNAEQTGGPFRYVVEALPVDTRPFSDVDIS